MTSTDQSVRKDAINASPYPNLGLQDKQGILPNAAALQNATVHVLDIGQTEESANTSPGLCMTALARLPPATLLDERALAACLSVSTRTLRRMVGRGQLFQGVKLGGRRMWVAGKVLDFLADATDRMIKATQLLVVRRGGIGE